MAFYCEESISVTFLSMHAPHSTGTECLKLLGFLFWSSLLATEGAEPVEYLFNLFDFVICIHFFLHLFLHFSFYFDLIELYESRRRGRLSCPRGLISRHVDPNLKRL